MTEGIERAVIEKLKKDSQLTLLGSFFGRQDHRLKDVKRDAVRCAARCTLRIARCQPWPLMRALTLFTRAPTIILLIPVRTRTLTLTLTLQLAWHLDCAQSSTGNNSADGAVSLSTGSSANAIPNTMRHHEVF